MKKHLGALLMAVLWLSGCATIPGEIYDAVDEPKAKGLRIRVNYPAGWKQAAGDSEDMLVQFLHTVEPEVEMLMLQVYAIEEEGVKHFFPIRGADSPESRYLAWEYAIGSLADTKVVSVADVAVPSGRPAVLLELAMLPVRSEGMTYVRMKMLHVYEKGRIVIVSCGAGGKTTRKAAVDLLLEESTSPVCQLYFDSLRFVE